MNITVVFTNRYDIMDTWSNGKNKPNFKLRPGSKIVSFPKQPKLAALTGKRDAGMRMIGGAGGDVVRCYQFDRSGSMARFSDVKNAVVEQGL